VGYARSLVDEVEFSCEDATRSEPEFAARVCAEAVKAGATTINLPDTVGYCLPGEYAEFIVEIRALCPELEGVELSVHCHDDLGLAVANTLAGIRAGATQVEATINGLGERAGNAALEEVVMALRVRHGAFDAHTDINGEIGARSSSSSSPATASEEQGIVGAALSPTRPASIRTSAQGHERTRS
jgi:2-isopropylmalate synthase